MPLGNHKRMLSPQSRLPAPPCRLCLVLPSDTRCCLLTPNSQLPRRCREVKAGGLLLRVGTASARGATKQESLPGEKKR